LCPDWPGLFIASCKSCEKTSPEVTPLISAARRVLLLAFACTMCPMCATGITALGTARSSLDNDDEPASAWSCSEKQLPQLPYYIVCFPCTEMKE
jgi:hypothetical protein